MNILIFGGTLEGRLLARRLAELGGTVTVSVATDLGAEALAGIPGIRTRAGRLDAPAMEALLEGYDFCVDATHPYAVEATANIRRACEAAGVPLRRLLRAEGRTEGDVLAAEDCPQAAELLAERPGRILLTTGSKELSAFAGLGADRLYARVLPTHESLSACEAVGLPHSHILALQGPFSRKLNEAMLEQYGIAWLVTKDGGAPGGFAEKCAAAQAAGAGVIVIGRSPEQGLTLEEILAELEEVLA